MPKVTVEKPDDSLFESAKINQITQVIWEVLDDLGLERLIELVKIIIVDDDNFSLNIVINDFYPKERYGYIGRIELSYDYEALDVVNHTNGFRELFLAQLQVVVGQLLEKHFAPIVRCMELARKVSSLHPGKFTECSSEGCFGFMVPMGESSICTKCLLQGRAVDMGS